ncbi:MULTISPECIES: DUF1631 family protein [Dyella]|uniref:DUF1631 family protein n=2 Tax=Dyella TaxID=231454 RepID=A0A4R0YPT5_9GAMM|nr:MULTISPECIES: DUF1631 family protein [Dyella]TBR36864.1 DUF1631 family protein [Dyella terrae]TCI08045.1 DUF1631 family protein [Dyella soli]
MDVEQQGRRQPFAWGRNDRFDSERWGPRTRRLVEETYALCISWLEAPLRICIADAEQRLFAAAERAHNHMDQQVHLTVRQQLQANRSTLEQHFAAALRRRFGHLGEEVDAITTSAHQPLSLVEQSDHEQTVALGKLAARGESRNATLLFELGYRFAVLVSMPPLEGLALPLGPHAMARAFHDAGQFIDMPVQHRLMLLDSFESAVSSHLATLYETVNQHLVGDGILPQLRAFPVVRQPERQRTASAAAPRERAPEPTPEPAPEAAPVAASQHPDHIAVLDSLREMLARQRSGYGTMPAGGRPATPEELELALGAVQHHLAHVTEQATRELQSAQRLREELLMQLNAGKTPDAQRTHLSAEQNDTVELVSLLFDQLGNQLNKGSNAHSLLGELQLPLLRMAVTDRGFFDQREHPARKLLGTVAEAANDWLDGSEGDPDRGLSTKLSQLVERARREPPSTGLYTSLLADIEHHLGMLNRKAQIAERRQIEAMQGRERLELARRQAARLMAERFELNPPRGLLRTLLERAWSDVLALTLLRNGEESDVFAARLRITDQLLGRLPVDDRERLLQEVETGLQQIGMHADEANQVAQRLAGVPDSAPAGTKDKDDAPTATGLAMKLKQHQRLGEHQVSSESVQAPAAPQSPHVPTPSEQRIHEHLRKLPFGSWFEFIDPASGRITPRKLAWYSPVSGNSLFVTRRGLRSEEISLERLAHEMASGRVREAVKSRDSLLDRAMHALTGSLRSAASPADESKDAQS